MSLTTLIYFPVRGFGEIVRLTLATCGIEFKEVHLTSREEFLKLRQELPFGQVPLLKIDGKNLVQSTAIVRYLARKHHLYGNDEADETKVDMYFDGSRDFGMHFYPTGFRFPVEKVKEMTENAVAKYLPFFEKILRENGNNGHLVGNALTLADLGLLEVLLYLKDYYDEGVLKDYHATQNFLDTMGREGFIEKYVKEIRTAPHAPERVTLVKKVLDMQ